MSPYRKLAQDIIDTYEEYGGGIGNISLRGYIERAISKSVQSERQRIIDLLKEESKKYLENSKKCDLSGNTFGAAGDISSSLALEHSIKMIKGE